jgi:hypothetical protein
MTSYVAYACPPGRVHRAVPPNQNRYAPAASSLAAVIGLCAPADRVAVAFAEQYP